nr:MAG TPA: hypothetical protein [Bacteriophage sp.]
MLIVQLSPNNGEHLLYIDSYQGTSFIILK